MKKPILAFILLLFVCLNLKAQDVAVSDKLKTYFHVPLLISGKNILVLSNEKNELKLESWNKALNTRTLVADIDLSALKEIGDYQLTDAFIIKDKLVIVESVFSRNPNMLGVYISQFDLSGNNLEPWEKIVEMERTNRIDKVFDWISALSPDKSKYILSTTSKWSKENAKYVLGIYDFNVNKLLLESSIQTNYDVATIDSSILSINDQGEFALWVGGEMDRIYKKSESNKDVHHLFIGNSKAKEVKEYPFELPGKFIGSTSILMQQNGDIIAMGMTMEDIKEPVGSDGYFRAVIKKGSSSVDFQTYLWRPELIEKYYSGHKVAALKGLPSMKTKDIFIHESGDMTFVTEEYYTYSYEGEVSNVYGSLYAVRMDASGKVIYDDLCFKYRSGVDMEMMGSLAFLANDTLRVVFKEHSDIWQDGKRVIDLSGLKQSQPYYCSLTCARFGPDGFTYDQMDTKQGKKMCVHLYPTSFLGGKTILGIGREVNALHFIRMTLP